MHLIISIVLSESLLFQLIHSKWRPCRGSLGTPRVSETVERYCSRLGLARRWNVIVLGLARRWNAIVLGLADLPAKVCRLGLARRWNTIVFRVSDSTLTWLILAACLLTSKKQNLNRTIGFEAVDLRRWNAIVSETVERYCCGVRRLDPYPILAPGEMRKIRRHLPL